MPPTIKRETLALRDGSQLRYALYREPDQGDFSTPLLICIHPGWEGQNPPPQYGEQFLSSLFIPAFAETGAVMAAPDCPGGTWNHPKSKRALLELLDHLVEQQGIDPAKVSLVGYSAGAWGIWYLLPDNAERFSSTIMFANLPVMEPAEQLEDNFPKSIELVTSQLDEWVKNFPAIPIYWIHSRDDELFPYNYARLVYEALLNDKRKVKFDTLQGVGHFDGEGYVESLREAVPWLLNTW